MNSRNNVLTMWKPKCFTAFPGDFISLLLFWKETSEKHNHWFRCYSKRIYTAEDKVTYEVQQSEFLIWFVFSKNHFVRKFSDGQMKQMTCFRGRFQ